MSLGNGNARHSVDRLPRTAYPLQRFVYLARSLSESLCVRVAPAGTQESRGSLVGIATCYGLDGPGIESRCVGARFSAPVQTGSECLL